MRRLALAGRMIALLLPLSGACAARGHAQAAPEPAPAFMFSERVPGAAQVCVSRYETDGPPYACMRVDDLRRTLRGIRRASAVLSSEL